MHLVFKILLYIGLFLTAVFSFAQSTETNNKIDEDLSKTTKTTELNANATTNRVNTDANIDLTINTKINPDAINNTLKQYVSKNDGNFLMETLPEDNDIRGKRYLNNEDITHKQLGTNMDLGTVSTNSKEVRVVCRDHSYVDGDIIKIYINGQSLPNNIVLKGSSFSVYLKLDVGYNRIDFQAMNQGLSGPNTAELQLYDEDDNLIASKEWNLLTGGIATIGVIQKRQ